MSLSLRARLIRAVMPLLLPKATSSVARQRAAVDRTGIRPRRVEIDPIRIGGVPGHQVRPRGPYRDHQILHFHGGGFVVGSSETFLTMTAEFATRADAVVTSIDYRLAPEHPFPAAIDDCLAAYRSLLDLVPAGHVSLLGESAGGNAVLSLLVRARDEGLPLPSCAVVFSPWTDLTMSGASVGTNAATEVVLSPDLIGSWRDAYVGDADPADPAVSPLFADLSGLPPLHVQATTAEIFEDDARRLVDRATAAGVDVEAVFHDELWHVFQTQAPNVPESTAAVVRAVEFLLRHR